MGWTATDRWTPTWVQPYDPATGWAGRVTDLTRSGGEPTPLPDGRVLFTGGVGPRVDEDGWREYLATAETYDPATGAVTPVPSNMSDRRVGHSATVLRDGRVLLVGGITTDANPVSTVTADLFVPTTGVFQRTGVLRSDRAGHSAALLGDGRVLILGGYSGELENASVEIYDPGTGAFSLMGWDIDAPAAAQAVLLPDGRILVVGSSYQDGQGRGPEATIYEPRTGKGVGPSALSSIPVGASLTLLDDGRVLVAGGHGASELEGVSAVGLFDPETDSFHATGAMTTGRGGHNATLLPDGRVLVVGGMSCDPAALPAEIYDPAAARFVPAPIASSASIGTLLPASCPVARPSGTFLALDGSCAIRTDGTLACWGSNSEGQATPPSGSFTAVSGTCAIRSDGTLACWGEEYAGNEVPAEGTFAAVGGRCGLHTNGEVECWGPVWGSPVDGRYLAISGSTWYGCGVRADGSLTCWGDMLEDMDGPPEGTFLDVSADQDYACAIRTNGTIACWGIYSPAPQPAGGTFMAISGPCGIRTDGTLACWGDAQTPTGGLPDGRFTHISGTCAIRTDGALVCWP